MQNEDRQKLSRSARDLRLSRQLSNPSPEVLEKRSTDARVLGLAGGRLGGVSKSSAKVEASRANGKLGGRPRKSDS
jgi:hypothetical protein